ALLWRVQRAGNCRDAGHHRTHGAARLGEGAADPCRDAALSTERLAARPAPEGPMRLTIRQMALMSRLLDEALPLDEAGRRLWLVDLSPEYQDLAQALRGALLPEEGEGAEVQSLEMLPNLQEADAPSGLHPGANVGPYELLRSLGSGG